MFTDIMFWVVIAGGIYAFWQFLFRLMGFSLEQKDIRKLKERIATLEQRTADPDADGTTKQANIAGEHGEVKE